MNTEKNVFVEFDIWTSFTDSQILDVFYQFDVKDVEIRPSVEREEDRRVAILMQSWEDPEKMDLPEEFDVKDIFVFQN